MISDINIKINRDLCFNCGECVDRCIMDNLRMYMAPCRNACPIQMNCQGYVRLLAQGKSTEAAQEMRKGLPFAGILGRVCTHPCEDKCERNAVDGAAVHIRALKRHLADSYPEIAYEPAVPAKATNRRVAVVGSGPAGLMAAHDMALQGHQVTVFESATEPGGILRWGIPAFRLPAREISQSVEMLEKMKVRFECGRTLGKDLDLDKLELEWDAVLLAIGGGPAAKLNIPGEDLPNVHHGLDLLCQARQGQATNVGPRAIIIGGGNVAVDAALTCRRWGASEVSLVCLEEEGKMPAFQAEIREAMEEGIQIIGSHGPQRILQDSRGLTVEFSRCLSLYDQGGRFCPQLDDACSLSASADTVVVAIGQRAVFAPDACGRPYHADLAAKDFHGRRRSVWTPVRGRGHGPGARGRRVHRPTPCRRRLEMGTDPFGRRLHHRFSHRSVESDRSSPRRPSPTVPRGTGARSGSGKMHETGSGTRRGGEMPQLWQAR